MNRVERLAVIELVGGLHDGRQMVLSPTEDGLPVSELPVPGQTYRRDVFAEERDHWIYRPVT